MLLNKINIEFRGRGKNASSADNQQETLPLLNSGRGSSETIRQILQMNKEPVSLLGILFTDGCVSPKGVNSWRIYFANKSETLIELFQECIVKVFNLDVNRVRIGKTKDGFLGAVVDSKEIGNWLTTKFGNFRTLKFKNGKFPKIQLPISELRESGYTKEFLKVAFSCDGGLCFYPAYRRGKR
ncbi:MAG: hypothetical protein ACPL4K_04100, partial [Candidatus Margulisiibacteriota bacterium]